jgi:hypothetical protein
MRKLKLLPAVLIAAAMLITPVVAQEHRLRGTSQKTPMPARVTLTGISVTRLRG